jgi:hypothetical protein
MATRKSGRTTAKSGARQRGRPAEFEERVQRIVLLERVEAEALEDLAWEARMSFSKYVRGVVQRHLKAKGRLPSQ